MDNGWVQLAIDLGLVSCSAIIIDEDDAIEKLCGKQASSSLRRRQQSQQQRQNLHSVLAAEVLRQILRGLAYCHSCGVVHRDIKVGMYHVIF